MISLLVLYLVGVPIFFGLIIWSSAPRVPDDMGRLRWMLSSVILGLIWPALGVCAVRDAFVEERNDNERSNY